MKIDYVKKNYNEKINDAIVNKIVINKQLFGYNNFTGYPELKK